jgi:hypothetical protein
MYRMTGMDRMTCMDRIWKRLSVLPVFSHPMSQAASREKVYAAHYI